MDLGTVIERAGITEDVNEQSGASVRIDCLKR